MQQLDVIDRLMNVTGDWYQTFELLDKYPLSKSNANLTLVQEPVEVKVYPPQKTPKKRFRLREGSLKEQIMEALQVYPDSTINDLVSLTGRESDDVSMVSARCKQLFDDKILVRSKNADGKYAYRLAESESVTH